MGLIKLKWANKAMNTDVKILAIERDEKTAMQWQEEAEILMG